MKTLVVLSGGMDSATLLYDCLANGDHVEAVSVNYQQRHKKELACAAKLAELCGVRWECIDLSSLGGLLVGNSQSDPSVPVPFGRYDEPSMKQTVVPNRNMVLLASCAAVAIARGMDRVAYGAHAGDHAIYPDCRPEFVEAMAHALSLCDWGHLDLYVPYLDWTKGDIAKRGLELGVPYDQTWTCYVGQEQPCGQCGACVERAEAFAFAEGAMA